MKNYIFALLVFFTSTQLGMTCLLGMEAENSPTQQINCMAKCYNNDKEINQILRMTEYLDRKIQERHSQKEINQISRMTEYWNNKIQERRSQKQINQILEAPQNLAINSASQKISDNDEISNPNPHKKRRTNQLERIEIDLASIEEEEENLQSTLNNSNNEEISSDEQIHWCAGFDTSPESSIKVSSKILPYIPTLEHFITDSDKLSTKNEPIKFDMISHENLKTVCFIAEKLSETNEPTISLAHYIIEKINIEPELLKVLRYLDCKMIFEALDTADNLLSKLISTSNSDNQKSKNPQKKTKTAVLLNPTEINSSDSEEDIDTETDNDSKDNERMEISQTIISENNGKSQISENLHDLDNSVTSPVLNPPNKKVTCPYSYCQEVHSSNKALARHIRSKHNNEEIPCPFPGCNNVCTNSAVLHKHNYNVHNKKEIPCTYPGCNNVYNSNIKLAHHIDSVHNKKEIPCTYPGCDKVCNNLKALENHNNYQHRVKEVICSACGKVCQNPTKFALHIRSAHGKEVSCPTCNKVCKNRQALHEHKYLKHRK